MRTRFKYNIGRSETRYSGFQSFRGDLQPGDRVILAHFDGDFDSWIVDCEEGIAELRRYYAEQFERHEMDFTILLQDLPMHVVDIDFDDGCATIGPFWSREAADRYVLNHENNYVYIAVCEVDKP